jgi:DNA-binding NarL/FixJ family response regulator
MDAPAPITVLVADDHTIVRRGLVSILSLADGISVVAEAEDGREAVDLSLKLRPDVVLMDISMPRMNGLEATEQLQRKDPRIRVLILSAHDNDEYVQQVVRSGAHGYLLKNSSHEELFHAIRTVHAGNPYFVPSVERIAAAEAAREDSSSTGGVRLTPREREVLQLVAEGRSHLEVASLLSISVRTVDTHCNNIMQKLDIHDVAGLATYAIKNGILILP